MLKKQWIFQSPIGALYLVASYPGLEGVYFNKQSIPLTKNLTGSDPSSLILAQAVRELMEYFAGKRQLFDIPLVVQGTEFQRRVWKQLQTIPYGKTCSYRDVAAKLKNNKAFRAVGNANGKNPHAIIVPCHRVIAADGTLGGYGGGLGIKTKLLKLETDFSCTNQTICIST